MLTAFPRIGLPQRGNRDFQQLPGWKEARLALL